MKSFWIALCGIFRSRLALFNFALFVAAQTYGWYRIHHVPLAVSVPLAILLGLLVLAVGALVAQVAFLWIEHRARRRSAYARGYEFARRVLYPPGCGHHEYDSNLVQELYALADGAFNRHKHEREFDRGVRTAVVEYEREFGAP